MNDDDKTKVLLTITVKQDDFLRTINPDNKSEAIRQLIDDRMQQTRIKKIEHGMLYAVFIIDIVILLLLYFSI